MSWSRRLLYLGVLLAVSGAAKLLTQARSRKHGWEIISIHATATGLSLLPPELVQPVTGAPCGCVLAAAEA